ncbi:MAG: hypothetical protein J7K21_01565, partial [Desulfurococcales archaeon]|nr:hypothetical protein [Desulfurococcales archaeon]
MYSTIVIPHIGILLVIYHPSILPLGVGYSDLLASSAVILASSVGLISGFTSQYIKYFDVLHLTYT